MTSSLNDALFEPHQRWEAFYVDGEHVGAIFRDIASERITTRIAFPTGAEQWYRAESVVRLSGGTWLTSRYWQEQSGIDNHISREGLGLGADTLPGYAEFLLVDHVARHPETPVTFDRIDDGASAASAQSAVIAVEGTTTVTPPGSEDVQVNVLTVRSGENVHNSHWESGGELIGSDWNGAQSFLVGKQDAAVQGLADDVVEFLLGGPSR